jgi:GNAT superfamily N-acetyltransferase
MRLYEFITEAKTTREDFEGMTIEMVKNGHVLVINALDDWGNNILGSVAFNIGDDNDLDPQDLKVDERYQGQGIAKIMYDYAKSKGYEIHRSYDQTDAGRGFWNKHRGEDVRVWESFDQPYPVKFEHSEYGDVDALTRLPDGTYLSIMFNQESGHDGNHPSHYSVEFYRNSSQEVTGEGDAYKVFATVIEAIRQFVIKMKPDSISFSASKEPEVDMARPGANVNPESRAKLYNRLVQRYAGAMGYSVKQQEGNNKVTYTLRKSKAGVAENADNKENPERKVLNPDVYEDLDNGIIARVARQIVPTIRAKSTPEGYVYLKTADGLSLVIGCSIADGSIGINIGTGHETTSSGPHKGAVTKIIQAVYQAAVKKYGTPSEPGTLSLDHDAGHGVWQHIAHKLGLQYDAYMVKENFADGRNPQDKGDSKRYHVPTKSSVSNLRKFAKSHSGRAAQLAHWAANMKAGRAKKK